jgi:hypothetical protein
VRGSRFKLHRLLEELARSIHYLESGETPSP